tara:strand:- start:107 stop:436 length:330 start_codon:yes stop_codon:yes gene_type:complete
MAKILNTALPLSEINGVTPQIFNKAIRLIELNLNAYDPSATPQFTNANISQLKFNTGDIIWNLSISALQVYTGTAFENISTPPTAGLAGTPSVGTVQVITNGSITVDIT